MSATNQLSDNADRVREAVLAGTTLFLGVCSLVIADLVILPRASVMSGGRWFSAALGVVYAFGGVAAMQSATVLIRSWRLRSKAASMRVSTSAPNEEKAGDVPLWLYRFARACLGSTLGVGAAILALGFVRGDLSTDRAVTFGILAAVSVAIYALAELWCVFIRLRGRDR